MKLPENTTPRGTWDQWLRECILPFWLTHAAAGTNGGYITCLNGDGTAYDTDKLCMWSQGRIAWTFARMYNELAPEPRWLAFARRGTAFILQHGFAPDGSMYYALTGDGRPLAPARDVYTELSTILAFAEVARADGDAALANRAHDLLLRVWERFSQPGQAYQPCLPETRPVRLHGHAMITLNVLQELRRCQARPEYEAMIESCIALMLAYHLHPEHRAVFEVVLWDGSLAPGALGRWVNPGHMIEGGTFLVHEGQQRGNAAWLEAGIRLIDWGFEHGWDREFGGIYNDIDVAGQPIPDGHALVAGAKLWWQHAEALYGLLLAYRVTGEKRFLAAYRQVHAYSFEHFTEPVSGEWIAALDRRGYPMVQAVGTARKNCFHLGRNVLLLAQLEQQEG